MVIQPYRKYMDLAIHFFRYMVEYPTAKMRFFHLRTARDHPAFDRSGDHRNISSEKKCFGSPTNLRYAVPPTYAAADYSAVPYLQTLHSGTYDFINENDQTFLSAFDDGRLDAQGLAKKLDQLL